MRIILIYTYYRILFMTSRVLSISLLLLSLSIAPSAQSAEEVNIYSARQEVLIRPLLDAFTTSTGITVNVISSDADALLNRIENEAQNSPADVLLTTDAGRLWRAKTANVLSTVESEQLNNLIPSHLRDTDNQWFGLSVRARPIMVNTAYAEKVGAESLPSTYADLANEQFAKQICIRSSSNIYNQSLVASMLAREESQTVETWAIGLVNNMARSPQGGDRDQIKAAALGQCAFAVANTYYLASMLGADSPVADQQAAQAITVIWPNQSSTGTHINISGAGVLKHAPNRANAIALLHFLASDEAQSIYANVNYEYPVRDGIELNSILAQWGDFKADTLDLTKLGEHNAEAVKLMDRAKWR